MNCFRSEGLIYPISQMDLRPRTPKSGQRRHTELAAIYRSSRRGTGSKTELRPERNPSVPEYARPQGMHGICQRRNAVVREDNPQIAEEPDAQPPAEIPEEQGIIGTSDFRTGAIRAIRGRSRKAPRQAVRPAGNDVAFTGRNESPNPENASFAFRASRKDTRKVPYKIVPKSDKTTVKRSPAEPIVRI